MTGATSVTTVAAAAWLVVGGWAVQEPAPPRVALDQLLSRSLGFSARQVAAVHHGEAVTTLLPGAVDHEIVVAGAVRIAGPAERTADLVKDIERFESGRRFLQVRKTSDPPRLADFSTFRFTPSDLTALRACRPGNCEVKLGPAVIPELTALDWTRADAPTRADALVREHVLGYIEGYRQRGSAALAVYHDHSTPVATAAEFDDMVARSRPLADLAGPLVDDLRAYPGSRGQLLDEFYYWSVSDLGLKPLFRVNHVVRRAHAAAAGRLDLLATRLLYANHYLNAGLEVRALFDDPTAPGRAHVLVALSLARIDGTAGVFGRLVKVRVRGASRDGMVQVLRGIRQRVEAGPAAQP